MTTTTKDAVLSDADQKARRDWFRRHWETNVPFNRTCRISVRRWDEDGVEMVAAYSDELSAHVGIFHGGVIATLIDTAGTASVMAGHDFNRGSRISTAAMSLQYLSVARSEDVVATARTIKRGRTVHVASVEVHGATSGRLLATGQVTATIEGERPGLLGPLPGDDAPDA
jgi:uncharacterized protein (TIGR00369 family)